MDNIHLEKQENVIISVSDPILDACQADEIRIRPIDMKDTSQILNEIKRLSALTTKYNKNKDEPRDHIKRQDYETASLYKEAKERNRKDYYHKCYTLEGNIAMLSNKNTELCRERVENTEKVYNADELEYLKQRQEEKKLLKRRATWSKSSSLYYEKNKDKIRAKRIMKKKNEILEEKKDIPDAEKVLIKTTKIIKPLCVCGRKCDVFIFSQAKRHSNIVKHRLFKSVIALIHYWRRNGTVKNAINKINNNLIDYKRVVREGTATIINKTDKEMIELYNDLIRPIDENKTHQPRPSYITRREYTKNYKFLISVLRCQTNDNI
jgi:hypothetical protein